MIINIICLLFILTYILLVISIRMEIKVNLDIISIKLFGLTIFKTKSIKFINRVKKIKKRPISLKESVSYVELIKEIKVNKFDVLYGNNDVFIYDYLMYGLVSMYNSIIPKYIDYIAPIHLVRSLNEDQIEIKVKIRFRLLDVIYRIYSIRRLANG